MMTPKTGHRLHVPQEARVQSSLVLCLLQVTNIFLNVLGDDLALLQLRFVKMYEFSLLSGKSGSLKTQRKHQQHNPQISFPFSVNY